MTCICKSTNFHCFLFSFVLYNNDIVLFTPQKAKKKPVAKKKPSDYGVEIDPRVQVLSVVDPPSREAGQKVENVEELVSKLKDAGVI